MTNKEAIEVLQRIKPTPCRADNKSTTHLLQTIALEMAIQALENIGHLKDRPCSVCEFRKENGCSQWTCVFTDRLFGDMR